MSPIDALTRLTEGHAATLQRIGRGAANLFLVTLWTWLYWPIFGYLSIIFSREDFRTNQILLLGVVALIVMRLRNQDVRFRLDASPAPRLLPLVLIVGGSVGFLLVERYLDINTVSASLFGLATYGLLGLWIAPVAWRQGLPAILLLIGTLPFGDHLQTFVGYPMRIATAAMVQDGLRAVGVHSVGIDTILVLENGVSQIDLPCSGVKSLWTGMLFLIAATWIERRPINWRWFGIAALMGFLLFFANLARVAVLVVVGQVAGWRLAAEMLHVPLGVLGFAAVCAIVVGLLQLQRPFDSDSDASSAENVPAVRPVAWLHPALMIFPARDDLPLHPRPEDGPSAPPPTWDFLRCWPRSSSRSPQTRSSDPRGRGSGRPSPSTGTASAAR
ncbi:MAG: archaeosortase/exosortase family protein [Caldilineaceae bacterium]